MRDFQGSNMQFAEVPPTANESVQVSPGHGTLLSQVRPVRSR